MLQDAGPKGVFIFLFADAVLNQLDLSAQLSYYLCNVYDANQEEAWEAKSRVMFYVGYIRDILMFLVYPACITGSIFLAHFRDSVTVPYHAIRVMIELGYALYTKTLKLMRFRAATRHMEKRYPAVPDAQIAEMRDRTCIICREEFVMGAKAAMDVPRKLSCGHVFHHRCLHSWLERQQSCPTCRKDVLQTNDTRPPESDPLNQQEVAENQERALEAPQADAEQRPEPQEIQDPSPSSTLQALIHRFQGPETSNQHPTPAQSAHDLLQEVRPGLADELVQSVPTRELDAPSESVREAVRRATLERHSQTANKQPDQPNSNTPILIPLFDPAQIPDFASKHQSQLPYPLADWVTKATLSHSTGSKEPAGSMEPTAPLEAQMKEKMAALQEAEALIERAKAQLRVVLGSTEALMKGKARDEQSS